MFSLHLSDKAISEGRESYYKGEIRLGTFREGFRACACYWHSRDYEQHWLTAASLILDDHYEKSAFITNMHDPAKADHIVWWPMWRIKDKLYVRNQLLFLDQLTAPFALHFPFAHVPDRRPSNRKEKVSEWAVGIPELRDFQRQLSPRS